MIKYITA